jgi:hypothetical protein
MQQQYEVIAWEAIKDAVPSRFKKMHHYLSSIEFRQAKNGSIECTILEYSLPYRSELGMEGFVFDYHKEGKKFFSNIEVQYHWIPDYENPKYWEHERKFNMMKNPYIRIESQTITLTLKKKIKI